MASNETPASIPSLSKRPPRSSVIGKPSGSNPIPGGVRGVPASNPGRGNARTVKIRRPPPPTNSRGKSYSDYESNLMLDIVEEILPHGQEMWVRVAEVYQSRVDPGYEVLDAESLRAKFKTLISCSKAYWRSSMST